MIKEQTIVSDGVEELFILKNFTRNNMNCINELQKQAKDKIDISVSFRQVSHIESTINGLTFFFAVFANSDLPADPY